MDSILKIVSKYIEENQLTQPKMVEALTEYLESRLIEARIEGAIREIVRLTITMSDGTSAEEYQKALSILYKEKRMLRAELIRINPKKYGYK